MAHFAELNISNTVQRVIVVADEDCLDENGNHSEEVGIQFCENLLGGTWIQTSYSGAFRKQYAGIGDTYDATKDKFIQWQPFPSWTLGGDDEWHPPIVLPDDGKVYEWDESAYQADNTTGWVLDETKDPPGLP